MQIDGRKTLEELMRVRSWDEINREMMKIDARERERRRTAERGSRQEYFTPDATVRRWGRLLEERQDAAAREREEQNK